MLDVYAWRMRLTIAAIVVFGCGLLVSAIRFILQVMPSERLAGRLIDLLGEPLFYGGSALIVLGAVILVIRWRLPYVISRPRGLARASSSLMLAAILVIGGFIAYACMNSAQGDAEALFICTTQEC